MVAKKQIYKLFCFDKYYSKHDLNIINICNNSNCIKFMHYLVTNKCCFDFYNKCKIVKIEDQIVALNNKKQLCNIYKKLLFF